MSRDASLAWAEQQPAGRFERIDVVVVAMAPERVGHNICKFAAHRALRDAARQSGLPCQVLGVRVVVSVDDSDFEPDVVLHCAERLPRNAIAVPEPLVIVEVLPQASAGSTAVPAMARKRVSASCTASAAMPSRFKQLVQANPARGRAVGRTGPRHSLPKAPRPSAPLHLRLLQARRQHNHAKTVRALRRTPGD